MTDDALSPLLVILPVLLYIAYRLWIGRAKGP